MSCGHLFLLAHSTWQLYVRPVLYAPLYNLYFYGPEVVGLWEGKSYEEICSRLTAVNAGFWESSPGAKGACTMLIDKKMDAVVSVLLFVNYCYVLLRITRACVYALEKKLTGGSQHAKK